MQTKEVVTREGVTEEAWADLGSGSAYVLDEVERVRQDGYIEGVRIG